jgi:hypothetical protein
LYAAAGLLVLVGAAIGYPWIVKSRAEPTSTSRVQTSVPPLRMGFSANREGPVWKLSWDRGAMEVIKPSGAVLTIKDGNSEQQLNLPPADLSNGTIFYTPQSGDLLFSLQLQNGGATPLEEHIRVLEGPQNVQNVAERNPQTLPNNIGVQAKASSRGSTLPAEPPRTTSSGVGRDIAVSATLSTSVRPNPVPTETGASPTIIREVPPSPVEIPQPPAVAFAVPIAPRFERPVDLPPPPKEIPQPTPNPGGSAPQKIALAPESVVQNPPIPTRSTPLTIAAPATPPSAAISAQAKSTYIGPIPVQQVRPQPPPNVKSSGVQIQVHIEIDPRGNVTKATPIGATVANFALTAVTVRAARSWHFEPAKMEGQPVPSEMDLVFKF